MSIDELVPESGNLKNFIEQFPVFSSAPGGVDKLRDMILKLAVSGKLTHKGISSDIDSEINKALANKKRYEKELSLRKNKDLPALEKQPYKIPSHWRWLKLEDIACYVQRGKGPKYDDENTENLVVSQKCIQWDGFNLGKARGILNLTLDKYAKERFLKKGDLLWNSTGTGTVGRIIVLDGFFDEELVADSHVTVVRLTNMEPRYIWCCIANPWVQDRIEPGHEDALVSGSTKQVELSTTAVRGLPIPIAPIEEQKRIVAKVDELMALCDQLEAQQQQQANNVLRANNAAIAALLNSDCQSTTSTSQTKTFEQNWQRIAQHFNTLYGCTLPMPPGEGRQKKYLVGLENMKSFRHVILQLAIQGKLVAQNSSDESAEILLAKLEAENKGVKIKGKRAVITSDVIEHPFGLPSGWVWAKFPQLGEWGRGKSKHRPRNDPALFKDGKWPLIQTGDVAKASDLIVNYSKTYSEYGLEQSKLWPKGTLCITIAANIADSAILGIDACFPDSVVGLVPHDVFGNARYFEYFIRTAKSNLTDFAPSTAQKNINLGILEQVNIPLPPLAEQKRIVKKVDEFMIICDQLEQQLIQSYSEAEKLMNATVKALVA